MTILVRMSSQEFGHDDFPRESMREALATIQNLVTSAEAHNDGVERLIAKSDADRHVANRRRLNQLLSLLIPEARNLIADAARNPSIAREFQRQQGGLPAPVLNRGAVF